MNECWKFLNFISTFIHWHDSPFGAMKQAVRASSQNSSSLIFKGSWSEVFFLSVFSYLRYTQLNNCLVKLERFRRYLAASCNHTSLIFLPIHLDKQFVWQQQQQQHVYTYGRYEASSSCEYAFSNCETCSQYWKKKFNYVFLLAHSFKIFFWMTMRMRETFSRIFLLLFCFTFLI